MVVRQQDPSKKRRQWDLDETCNCTCFTPVSHLLLHLHFQVCPVTCDHELRIKSIFLCINAGVILSQVSPLVGRSPCSNMLGKLGHTIGAPSEDTCSGLVE